MHERAARLIEHLGMVAHPEGGYFCERHRSSMAVTLARGHRDALTAIYFLLPADERSRWHRVTSDEIWHHCEGAPLELLSATPDDLAVGRTLLGSLADGHEPFHVVMAEHWQAARSTGNYTLVTCTVGPGFDFEDFQLMRDDPEESSRLRRIVPEFADFI